MDHMEHVYGTYNVLLIFISYIIAVAAAYSALDLAGRVNRSIGRVRQLWLLCGAMSMGLGIWSMHFVGMLAFKLPVQVSYDVTLVVLSVLFAAAGSYIALYVVCRAVMGAKELVTGGLLMATSICAMHYTGMAAMKIEIDYDPIWVGLSIVVALTASLAALYLIFKLGREEGSSAVSYKLGSGMLMGAAIAGMHYIGMEAASFHIDHLDTQSNWDIEPGMLAYLIAFSTLAMLGVTMFGAYVSRRLVQKDSAIQESEVWYRSLYNNNSDGIIAVDLEGRIIDFNPAVKDILGLKLENHKNSSIFSLNFPEEFRTAWDTRAYARYSMAYTREDGFTFELVVMHVPVVINDTQTGLYILLKDVTEEKRAQLQIEHLAYHDELTGLPNRRRFNQLLRELIEDSKRSGGGFAMMVLDLDRFKMINDSLGHTNGDIFLQEMSGRINKSIAQEAVTLSRLGGDEFTLLCHGMTDEQEISKLAERVIKAISVPYRLKDNDFYVTASIGIAVYPVHGDDGEKLLRNADAAMYEVKRVGKNGFQFFSTALNEELQEKLELEGDLRKALERGELQLFYQPQMRATDNQMIGVEALIRWHHPVKGVISPGLFIPIAEDTGIIYDIGTWVLRTACQQMKAWHDAGGPLIPVSVNLSSQQFHQSNLVELICGILDETGLEPHYLELEITESMMMDAALSTGVLNELNRLGIRISLDDFGTGYSSLSYLKLFPIHKLKIDRSFITDITHNDNDKALVATIIAMAQNLNMNVIAEGIETKDQLDFLTANDCQEIQGYYFSRPLSAADVEKAFFEPQRHIESLM